LVDSDAVWSLNDTLCQMGVSEPQGRRHLGVELPAKSCSCFHLNKKYDSLGGSIDLRVLRNYFDSRFYFYITIIYD